MSGLVKLGSGFGFLALLLSSACASAPAGPSADGAAVDRARLAAVSLLPECEAAFDLTQPSGHLPECRLDSSSHAYQIVLKTDPLLDEPYGVSGFMTLTVLGRNGALIGEFFELTFGPYGLPRLTKVDRERGEDLVIPIHTLDPAARYAVWLRQENGDFARAGEIAGAVVRSHSHGLFSGVSRMGLSEWQVSYYRLSDGALEELAIVSARGKRPPQLGGRCELLWLAEGQSPGRFCRR